MVHEGIDEIYQRSKGILNIFFEVTRRKKTFGSAQRNKKNSMARVFIDIGWI